MSNYSNDLNRNAHRETFKICIRCGKRKTIKASKNMWKRRAKYKTCGLCRSIERERGRIRRNAKRIVP
jgi:hypothetical protein